ncbi:MAG: hypothetical protein ACRDS0_41705, partial [Pseudonocardiaceae bacterium]
MPDAVRAVLGGFLVLAAAVWIGGFVTPTVVARAARAAIAPAERIAFFRRVGRSQAVVAGLAFAVGLASGTSLLYGRTWNGVLTATVAVAAGLVVATMLGVAQARHMT